MRVACVTFENLEIEDGQSLRLLDLIEHTGSYWEIDVISRKIARDFPLRSRICKYHELPIDANDALGTWIHQPTKVFRLLRMLQRIGRCVKWADIVYTDMIFANFYSPIVPPHQCLVMEVNGIIGEELVNKGAVVRGSWKHTLFRLLERWGYNRADHLIAVSAGLREYLIQEFGILPDRISVIPNGVDLRLFPINEDGSEIRRRYGLGRNPVIFFHGSFKSWHGLDHLVRCFRFIKDEVSQAYLMLVGDGAPRPGIERLVQESGLSESVIMTGMQPKCDIHKYIAAADVCVYYPNYSVGCYGFLGNPIKFYEYMAMQKPIVTTRLRGFSELIEENQCGLVVPATYQDFVRGVVTLLSDPEQARTLGRNGRRAVENTYNWPTIAQKIYTVCSGALAYKRASHFAC